MSGEGRKDDGEKVRIDLFPGDVLFAISDILTFGAKKYADRNWENGMAWGRVFSALMRHMWSWWQGRGPTNQSFIFGDFDDETKRSHLWHAGCCLTFLIAYEMRKVGTDDRPKKFEGATPKDAEPDKLEQLNQALSVRVSSNTLEQRGVLNVQENVRPEVRGDDRD